ncbi:methylated-DNA--[protein]-cysteine S-methyltransferase [Thiohalocapsa marina]|uniref:methylated-DNA--[protein]-cysteine S-methyltransferase n=1 Tax=Thiohalocapsa marina TaxID=424902 RepID=A0A5M8FSX0_9GAMM|nr:methylated-DNA--[protein]-cysteine S-methyltransferase [Thiohalocapsa marina]KAA6186252.1 methylated-DNA--[protein]-cysteine S-methyltransferase [Thiohalocapsa marina]
MSCLDTPVGTIGVRWIDCGVLGVDLEPMGLASGGRDMWADPCPDWLQQPLLAYFDDPGPPIPVPRVPTGTRFQQRVWQAISAIPAGSTRTYGELALELGTSARAVGGACRANPWPLLVPCHRVVSGHGLGGFAGAVSGRLTVVKAWLLAHEGVGSNR